MNLFPLLIAVAFILIGAAVVYFWPAMDPSFKRMFVGVIAIAVVICIVAVFWPLFAGHSMTVGR